MSDYDNKLLSIEYSKKLWAHKVSGKKLKGLKVLSKKFDTLFKKVKKKIL